MDDNVESSFPAYTGQPNCFPSPKMGEFFFFVCVCVVPSALVGSVYAVISDNFISVMRELSVRSSEPICFDTRRVVVGVLTAVIVGEVHGPPLKGK